jgi:hypothetical protein
MANSKIGTDSKSLCFKAKAQNSQLADIPKAEFNE